MRATHKFAVAAALLFQLALVTPAAGQQGDPGEYLLGPDDEVIIHAPNAEEIDGKTFRVDGSGLLSVATLGRIAAAGMSTARLEAELTTRLQRFLKEPQVSVDVKEFRSQPVSVLGAVGTPGVHMLKGKKTLYEILSLAGGLRPEAGNTIKITRQKRYGEIPLSGAADDETGKFSVAEVPVRSIMDASQPGDNIDIIAHDVISVPKADIVYVIGSVRKAGGFPLNEREPVSALQALALAEGLDQRASPAKARILRQRSAGEARAEIPVDLKRVLAGTAPDVALQPNDILFVPVSGAKNAGLRSLEAAIQLGTGIAIYRR